MPYSAIDGDVSDFIESMIEITNEYRTEELRNYLLNEGHPEADVVAAIKSWQAHRFEQVDHSWETFRLTSTGRDAVAELRGRID